MQLFESAGSSYAVSKKIGRWFPPPRFLTPPAAGIDISDASVKWLALSREAGGLRVTTFGEEPLSPGIVVSGVIHDVAALSRTLSQMKPHMGGISAAHAALPEEAAYVFSMHVPSDAARAQILSMIEFEFEGRVPILPSAAVYDFDVIQTHDDGEGEEIAVAVFPRELAESYEAAFEGAGITLLSLEVEARSIARAVSRGTQDEPITLLVDFGRERTGFAVLKRGIPIFTSTVDVGGDRISRAVQEKLSLPASEAETFRNDEGLLAKGAHAKGVEIAASIAGMLAEEVSRHYHYWDTRRNERGERMTPVGQVILVGGSANLKGLPDFIAGKIQAPAALGNVWQHVCSFDDYIPPIDRRRSLQYATAVGLALRSV